MSETPNITLNEHQLMGLLADAYERGFNWSDDNGDRDYLSKAALDYADKTVSALTTITESDTRSAG
jgi:hypothetical protein